MGPTELKPVSAWPHALWMALGENQPSCLSHPLEQGCQTQFHQGPRQPRGCFQRAEIILRLHKCNYSLTVKELKLHLAL